MSDVATLIPLLTPARLAALEASTVVGNFAAFIAAEPAVTVLEVHQVLTAYEAYRNDPEFRAAVAAAHKAAAPKRLPLAVIDHLCAVFRTAVFDLQNGNLSILEGLAMEAYAADEPHRTGRTDNLDALYEDRVARSDELGALIVDYVRNARLEPAPSAAERALEVLQGAALVVGITPSGRRWFPLCTATATGAVLTTPRGPISLDPESTVEDGPGGSFTIDGYRFQAYYQ